MDNKPVVWGPGDSPHERLIRVEEHVKAIHADVQDIKVFIVKHDANCPAKVHAAYFKLMGAALGLTGAGLIALMIKVFGG